MIALESNTCRVLFCSVYISNAFEAAEWKIESFRSIWQKRRKLTKKITTTKSAQKLNSNWSLEKFTKKLFINDWNLTIYQRYYNEILQNLNAVIEYTNLNNYQDNFMQFKNIISNLRWEIIVFRNFSIIQLPPMNGLPIAEILRNWNCIWNKKRKAKKLSIRAERNRVRQHKIAAFITGMNVRNFPKKNW